MLNISLKPYSHDIINQLVYLANNKNISDRLRNTFVYPYTEEDAKKWLTFVLNQPQSTIFAIVMEKSDIVDLKLELSPKHVDAIQRDKENTYIFVGGISITVGKDIHSCGGELGYWLGEPFWGFGIATQSVIAFVKHIFETFPEILRIFAEVHVDNLKSVKVLQKTGFNKEGLLKSNTIKNNVVHDSFIYAIYNFFLPT